MEKFLNLPVNKQKNIVNAGINAFGINGYKKASIKDIADAAGISKAMIFHYFGTKKDLYMYLAQFCGNMLVDEVERNFNKSETDFFERIRQATEIEVSVIRKYPSILLFLKSMYFETDEEIAQEIKSMLSQGESFRNNLALNEVDVSKFKESIDPKIVMKMLTWIAEGYVNQLRDNVKIDIEEINNEFYHCLNMLKQNLYKEEYL